MRRVIDCLLRDYKFKFLSSYDIIQFEQDFDGPDSTLIKKCISEELPFTSELVIRLIKRALASCGPRRFLIDGFPRNINDIHQFDQVFAAEDLDFKQLIHI
eukprot:GHVR01139697.1.p1 GENE.GHVR01139697.1~~GHVR01139697.1.p1  ORF type:complete len:101 (-),score=8.27 GHVR01139697.1:1465-1767(-)